MFVSEKLHRHHNYVIELATLFSYLFSVGPFPGTPPVELRASSFKYNSLCYLIFHPLSLSFTNPAYLTFDYSNSKLILNPEPKPVYDSEKWYQDLITNVSRSHSTTIALGHNFQTNQHFCWYLLTNAIAKGQDNLIWLSKYKIIFHLKLNPWNYRDHIFISVLGILLNGEDIVE